MDEHEMERLLYSGESDELDFKRDQYRLTNNDQKGEFIKDILAFANSWRTTDGFILIGIDETKVAGRSTRSVASRIYPDVKLRDRATYPSAISKERFACTSRADHQNLFHAVR